MVFSWILLAHWVGDFVFQTSRMATEKSKQLKWLSIHVITYTAVLLIFALFVFSFKLAITYVLINGVLHGITDFFTSKLSAKYQETPRIFFPILGMDQLIHTVTLYITYLNIKSLLFFLDY
ncbi:DUF3307 domain-containing protein [Aquimarina sp. 2201CG5-10]|uniref:DUF3307 domain-containing protein n=1 Tax=Aquimarina callyspongiae TaxID=3098150 RepID=UPI002AB3EDC2|nr:DUF3307 domain-containing protein [Aquimarina sp. 2201CG5-10]MDY8136136.1 DUF3307 domain-containing protein [Aquimarina sp. 2201CG5-10]